MSQLHLISFGKLNEKWNIFLPILRTEDGKLSLRMNMELRFLLKLVAL